VRVIECRFTFSWFYNIKQ